MTKHEQSTSNPEQTLSPEQLQAQDPAGNLIDIVRTVYSHANNDAQRESVFNPDGFDGTVDLLGIVADIRANEGSVLDEGQQSFVDYMAQQARTIELEEKIDFEKLEKSHKKFGDEAARVNLEKIADSIARKSSIETDESEKALLLSQRQSVFEYRKLIGAGETLNPGSGSTGHEFMEKYHAILRSNADTPDAIPELVEKAAQEMNERAAIFMIQAAAYEAIIEHGYKYHAVPSTEEVDMDSRLDYAAATNAATATPSTPRVSATPATPATPTAPTSVPPATPTPPPAAGTPQAGNAGTPPPTPPPAAPGATPPAGGNQPPAQGNTPNFNTQYAFIQEAALVQARKDQSEQKSRYIRNSRFGRAILSTISPDYEARREAIQNRYQLLVNEKYAREQADFINSQDVTLEDKVNHMSLSIQAEQSQLRDLMTERMKDFRMAKLGRFVLRHKKAVIIGSAFLAPFTGIAGVATGLGVGIGAVVTSYHDKLKRDQGVKAIDETAKQRDIYWRIMNSVNNNDNNAFMHGLELADRHTDLETTDVMNRRRNSLALGFAALMGTHVAAAYMSGPFGIADKSIGWMGRGAGNIATAIPYPPKPF